MGWEALDWICLMKEISDVLLWTWYRLREMQMVY